MTTADIALSSAPAVQRQPGQRDPRLDFFRGIAMFIILIAHTPGNWLTLWIPARFGFSDATETFVFCSGMASAIAFGATFDRAGWLLGTARVLFRVWQVYWAHIGLFFATLAVTIYMTELDVTTRNYWGQLNLWALFAESEKWSNPNVLLSFMTLRWVPNYFDILPMYMVVLLMMPVIIALKNVHVALAMAASVALWFCTQIWDFGFGAEPWSDRQWFFNPFGWQLIFFTGFALMAGWLPKPPVHRWLIVIAVAVVLVTLPFAYFRIIGVSPEIQAWRSDWAVLINKSDFGALRYVHFLATAYLAWVAVGERGVRILPPQQAGFLARVWTVMLAIIMKVGQQSLAVFTASMLIARVLGMMLDVIGRTPWTMLWVNLLGATLIVAVAYGAGWFKTHPWKVKKAKEVQHASA
ncbi:OpgC domain-containing protein [Shimia sp. R11_0]|uniref:OpgC family protein n=1 Tax=Shimia sp. R11_0 TaxID=2821096 RepID=UPI001ADC7B4F|nr:OpgC domain-containing protein [Shimia sp. R11_0]MBO9479395.1 OpgC domain-containing protein [Shimia sp. R11_0]